MWISACCSGAMSSVIGLLVSRKAFLGERALPRLGGRVAVEDPTAGEAAVAGLADAAAGVGADVVVRSGRDRAGGQVVGDLDGGHVKPVAKLAETATVAPVPADWVPGGDPGIGFGMERPDPSHDLRAASRPAKIGDRDVGGVCVHG